MSHGFERRVKGEGYETVEMERFAARRGGGGGGGGRKGKEEEERIDVRG